MTRLATCPCSGNVRELENVCERISALFAQRPKLTGPAYAELEIGCPELFATSAQALIGRAEAAGELVEVLAASHGHRLKAAQRLAISRSTPWRRIKAGDLCGC